MQSFGRFWRIGICAVAIMLMGSGCVSLSVTKSGEKEYWKSLLDKQSVSLDKLSPEAAAKKLEEVMTSWLSGQMGTLTEAEALKTFPEPTQRRATEFGRSIGWYYTKGRTFDWDVVVTNGNVIKYFDYILVLGFDTDGVMRNFEMAFSRSPSTTFGGTTKHVVQGAIAAGSMYLFANLMERSLTRVADHFVEKLRGLTPDVEKAITQGIQNAIPKGINVDGGAIKGSAGGHKFNINIPGLKLDIKK